MLFTFVSSIPSRSLIHWGRITHILCVENKVPYGLLRRRRVIISINAELMFIGPLSAYFREIFSQNTTLYIQKMISIVIHIYHDNVHSTTITIIKFRSDLHWRTTSHTSPLRASYGVSFVSYTKKNDRDISRAYCTGYWSTFCGDMSLHKRPVGHC